MPPLIRMITKILPALIIFITAILSVTAEGTESEEYSQTEAPGDFTHFVLGEEITATWCGFCPTASDRLVDVYFNDSYEFYFVALITDVNDDADRRTDDYPTFYGYPTTYFDGGDEEIVGASAEKSEYQQAVEDCGAREDTQVTIEMNVTFEGNCTINIDMEVVWEESSTILDPNLNTHLRVYITEIESRYLMYNNQPYHFGFLDYAFDQELELYPHQPWEESTTWVGYEHADTNGDDYGDIDFSNLAIIAAVFNDEERDTDEYSLECEAIVAPEIGIMSPEGVIQYNGTNATSIDGSTLTVHTASRYAGGEPVELTKVEYSLDGMVFNEMTKASGSNYTGKINTGKLEDDQPVITIRTTDDKGLVVWKEFFIGNSSTGSDEAEEWYREPIYLGGITGSIIILSVVGFVASKGSRGKKEDSEEVW